MSLHSINTNVGATIALESLNTTDSQLSAVQKQISTGYRVADATDDGAAYAIAQRVRSDVSALGSANEELGSTQGLISTTVSALNDVSNTLNSARDVLVKLANGQTTGEQRTQYAQQYNSLVSNIESFFKDATYNSKTLIGNIGGTAGFGSVAVVRNEVGATYGIAIGIALALARRVRLGAAVAGATAAYLAVLALLAPAAASGVLAHNYAWLAGTPRSRSACLPPWSSGSNRRSAAVVCLATWLRPSSMRNAVRHFVSGSLIRIESMVRCLMT